ATVLAVDRLGFQVRKGEVFALLGPNGAGKTTTIRMIMGILEPDSGRIDMEGGLHRSRLGYLPEERGLYQDVSVAETLLYLGSLRSSDRPALKARAKAWLERFDLYDRRNDKVSTLSKGNQQKVQFIASILHQPDLAILDEPFSGFDPINQELISACIRELADGGMTILLSAHQMQLVERLADRILLMNRGKEYVSGTMAEIRAKTRTGAKWHVAYAAGIDESRFAAIDDIEAVEGGADGGWDVLCRPDADVNRVIRHLTELGPIRDLTTSETTLHDIFIQRLR
ncbi:MAG: ATP-binding cassette domain-containing protein, partial [Leptolyngbyaceae bacterium]|nr:ATP-binding cassette domain-containing protein [Leptolyngbyaceae bacterium]